jgi:hypothetical protein
MAARSYTFLEEKAENVVGMKEREMRETLKVKIWQFLSSFIFNITFFCTIKMNAVE